MSKHAVAVRPSLGVLVTYHDERELLTECLESLLAPAERPDEIIVYDDASEAPAEAYVPPGAAVAVMRGDVNRGPASGRNVLLRASRSDYIHFHDADDLFHPNWCRRVRRAIQETSADAVFTEISSRSGDDLLSERVLGLQRLLAREDLVRFCIDGAMLAPAGTYRRTAVLAIGGYRETLWQSEDFDFHVRLAASGIRATVTTDPLILIRVRASGRSQSRVEVWSSAVQAINLLSRELPAVYRPDLADAAARAGSALFKLGARSEAREAFVLANHLGRPALRQQRQAYRLIAGAFGLEVAEQLGVLYRRWLPLSLRRLVARGPGVLGLA